MKDQFHMEISEDRQEIERRAKGIQADKYRITFHHPEGEIEADNFILSAVNRATGETFYTAKDDRPLEQSICMIIENLIKTTDLLMRILDKYASREEAERTIADIERQLRSFRKGDK